MATFTNIINEVVCKSNLFQETEDQTYPYMFDVSEFGVMVIHATNLEVAYKEMGRRFFNENIKYLKNI